MLKYFKAALFIAATGIYHAGAQQVYTEQDYQKAANMLGGNLAKYIDRANVSPNWMPDGTFWYKVLTATGAEYVLVNAKDGKSTAAANLKTLLPNYTEPKSARFGRDEVLSPDGTKSVFIKDWNLWLRDKASGKETALTTDGVKDFGYATDNAGWKHTDRAIVLWSPDSKKLSTFQQDQRHVNDMYLVKTKVGAPELQQWKYPLPTDKEIIKIHRVIIEVESGKITRLKTPADDRRGTLCDDIACTGSFDDNEWSADSKTLAFVSTPRDHKKATLKIADAATGDVRVVMEETVATQYESGQGAVNWKYLSETNEFIWYSERDNWGHLYLYDATTGKLKNQITKGDFVVTRILKLDAKNKTIYVEANGKEAGRNPYHNYMYKVDFAGKNITLLTPGDGNHRVDISPDGNYFVDNYSQTAVPNVAELRDMKGKLIKVLEKADITRLTAAGWKAPIPFTVKSVNNNWDLYGIMYVPSNLDPNKKYPVINYIYPGPQGGSISSWDFIATSRQDHQALAELGFVVFTLEGSCNPNRSKSFHDICYGNMFENTLPDQISGLKQMAQRYPYMDLDHVGVWGHSGGGYATGAAMFNYPDFYKVGISESGNHENRNYEDDWGERYIGLMDKDNYEKQANPNNAKNLKGKLMLVHGGLDDNVPPYNTYLVADALIKANKSFDMLVIPNARHGYAADGNYMMRRRWDYFVSNLKGAVPPKDYVIKVVPDGRN
ncbi:MAG: DPP IV N-terminal domain-containing protein [Ferruginibacter sp.]